MQHCLAIAWTLNPSPPLLTPSSPPPHPLPSRPLPSPPVLCSPIAFPCPASSRLPLPPLPFPTILPFSTFLSI